MKLIEFKILISLCINEQIHPIPLKPLILRIKFARQRRLLHRLQGAHKQHPLRTKKDAPLPNALTIHPCLNPP